MTRKVDVVFSVNSHAVHEQYAYALYSAVKQVVGPDVLASAAQVGPLEGGHFIRPDIYHGASRWRIRADEGAVLQLASLADSQLMVGEHRVTLGALGVEALRPARRLRAAWVRFGEGPDSQPRPIPAGHFRGRVARALERIGVKLGERRVVTGDAVSKHMGSRGRWLWGYGVTLDGLTGAESLLIQAAQIGGGRCLGGGMFTPVKRGRR